MEWHRWFWSDTECFLRKGNCYGMAQMVLVRHKMFLKERQLLWNGTDGFGQTQNVS